MAVSARQRGIVSLISGRYRLTRLAALGPDPLGDGVIEMHSENGEA